MNKDMRVLVVGGAGYIGSFTVRALVERGCAVTVYDDLSMGHKEAVSRGAELVEGNLADPGRLDPLFARSAFDAVIHFAALTSVADSVREPLKYFRANVGYTINLLECMQRHQVRKLVFSSTAATYGNPVAAMNEEHPQIPVNPYGETKLTVEKLLRALTAARVMSATALRYFNACGALADGSMGEDHTPETHLIPLVMRAALGTASEVTIFGEDYDTPDGTCIRDYIHVEDLASAHLAALDAQSGETPQFRTFNIGTGKGASIRQVISAVEEVTGKRVPVTIGSRRAGDPPILVADSSKLKRELDWNPRYADIREIISTVQAWMQKHPRGYADYAPLAARPV